MTRYDLVVEPPGLAALGLSFDDAWCELEARTSFVSSREREAARNDLACYVLALHRADRVANDRKMVVESYLRAQFFTKGRPGRGVRSPQSAWR